MTKKWGFRSMYGTTQKSTSFRLAQRIFCISLLLGSEESVYLCLFACSILRVSLSWIRPPPIPISISYIHLKNQTWNLRWLHVTNWARLQHDEAKSLLQKPFPRYGGSAWDLGFGSISVSSWTKILDYRCVKWIYYIQYIFSISYNRVKSQKKKS